MFATCIFLMRFFFGGVGGGGMEGKGFFACVCWLGGRFKPAAQRESVDAMCNHRLWVIYICLSVCGSTLTQMNCDC